MLSKVVSHHGCPLFCFLGFLALLSTKLFLKPQNINSLCVSANSCRHRRMPISYQFCKYQSSWGSFSSASFSSVQFSHSVMSDSLRLHEWQHARPPCPSSTPRVYPNPSPLLLWGKRSHTLCLLELRKGHRVHSNVRVKEKKPAVEISKYYLSTVVICSSHSKMS